MSETYNNDSNLKTLSEQYNNILTEYQNTYNEYISSLNKSATNVNRANQKENISTYSYKLEKLNQQLLDINQQILGQINSSSSNYKTETKQRDQKNIILDQNNNILTNERAQIQQMKNEFITINSANKNTELMLTQYYSRYIVLIFITILLVILLLKYSITGTDQRGGNRNFFVKESSFLFMIMVIFLGLAHVFNNINSYILFTIIIISYVVIKLKIVNTK